MGRGDGERVASAGAVVDLGIKAAGAYDRPDLAARLTTTRRRLDEPDLAVLVVGEFKQGKSTLVNALLNIDACAVDDDIATAVPTLVRFGEEPTATARYVADVGPDDGSDGAAAFDPAAPAVGADEAVPVPIDSVPSLVVGGADEAGRRIGSVELTVPRRLLGSGLSLMDTPGVGGLASEHGAATLGALPSARAVLFVTDASQELTQPELDFLRRAHALCPHLAVVLSKIDLYPAWRRIAELDRGHLDAQGLGDLPILAVSSLLRQRAVATDDAGLNRESGYHALVGFLRDEVLARGEELVAAQAGRDVVDVCAQLQSAFEAEREVLADPSRAEAIMAELREAEARTEQLRSGAARWQTTLSDGIQDLNADLDHDLRARFRGVSEALDERLADVDPPDVWDELEPWFRQLVAEEVAGNHQELLARADDLSRTIAELFAADAGHLEVAGRLHSPLETVEGVEAGTGIDDVAKPGMVTSGLGVLRGGYGGMMMFGMLAGMVGLTLATPVTVGVGLLMGRKQQKDEKKRQLTQRRQQAKQVCRTYVDAVSFQVSKQLRDQLRMVHRELRDGWAERAQELAQSTQSALESAQRAAADTSGGGRLADVEAELERIAGLRQRAEALAGGRRTEAAAA